MSIARLARRSPTISHTKEDCIRALELFQNALKACYKDAVHMKQDPDLDLLRDREEF